MRKFETEKVQGKRVILHPGHMSSFICKTATRYKKRGYFTEGRKVLETAQNKGKSRAIYKRHEK